MLAERERLSAERDRATAALDQPFPHAQALSDARRRSAQLATELTATDITTASPTAPSAGAGTPPDAS